MADSKPKKTAAAKAKRIVKNPETFRERAIKATEAGDQPSRFKRVRQTIGKLLRAIFRPFKAILVAIFSLAIFKVFRRPLRLIGRILLPKYFRESWRELKQVTWPTWQQSRQLTSAVLVFAIVFGAVIAVVDFGLDKLFRNILLK